jgi:hypothetical protein
MSLSQTFKKPMHFADDGFEIYAVRGDLTRDEAFELIRNEHWHDWDEDVMNNLGMSGEDLILGRGWIDYSDEEGEFVPFVQMVNIPPADVESIEVWILDLA